ncbi:hypothetical protein GE21DRAFT_1290281 [Neurospora crassa]|nr:hypothetical protein GE21DRAFT_1290281 [Neurospora crassa]
MACATLKAEGHANVSEMTRAKDSMFFRVICDEAQFLRNRHSGTFRWISLLEVPKHALIFVSAIPLLNRVTDLFAYASAI